MSECCGSKSDAAGIVSQHEPNACPSCAVKARPVATLTVKSIVRDHTRVLPEESYWFCRQPDCDVVYFSRQRVFRKADVKVRVGTKEHEEPIPICYCFDYTKADISRDLALRDETDIPNKVKAEVQLGFCACDVKNPSGTCCLGDITWAIQQIKGNRHVEPALKDADEGLVYEGN
jgi:hypothetical protein